MRTTKQLLKLCLKQGNLNFEKGNPYYSLYTDGYIGLCGFCGDLRDELIISVDECDILYRYILQNKPHEDSKHYYRDPDSLYVGQAYYWPRGEWNPRPNKITMTKKTIAEIILLKQIDEIMKPKPYKPEIIPDVIVKVGDPLNHQRFGIGTVISVDQDKCVVLFSDGSKKHLISKFAGFK